MESVFASPASIPETAIRAAVLAATGHEITGDYAVVPIKLFGEPTGRYRVTYSYADEEGRPFIDAVTVELPPEGLN